MDCTMPPSWGGASNGWRRRARGQAGGSAGGIQTGGPAGTASWVGRPTTVYQPISCPAMARPGRPGAGRKRPARRRARCRAPARRPRPRRAKARPDPSANPGIRVVDRADLKAINHEGDPSRTIRAAAQWFGTKWDVQRRRHVRLRKASGDEGRPCSHVVVGLMTRTRIAVQRPPCAVGSFALGAKNYLSMATCAGARRHSRSHRS